MCLDNHSAIYKGCEIQGASPKSGQISIKIFHFIAFARGCCWRPRKPDASSKQSYSQNGHIETKCGV